MEQVEEDREDWDFRRLSSPIQVTPNPTTYNRPGVMFQ
jgi:hypothetical protein